MNSVAGKATRAPRWLINIMSFAKHPVWQRISGLRLAVNFPVIVLVFVVYLGSQVMFTLKLLEYPARATTGHLFVWLAAIAVHGLLLCFLLMLVVGSISAMVPSRVRAFCWAAALAASSFFIWDYVGYQIVKLHLPNALRLFWENVLTDRQIMQTRSVPLLLTAAGYVVGPVCIAAVLLALERRWQNLSPRIPFLPVVAGVLCCASAGFVAALILQKVLPQQVYAVGAETLWTLAALRTDDARIEGAIFHVRSPIFRPPPRFESAEVLRDLARADKNARLPDIFVIIADSLRRDVVSPKLMPQLSEFSKECLSIEKTVANANATHPSLTAILHGVNPLYHAVYFHRDEYPGALPLRALKSLGYKIKVFASPDLEYFKFSTAAFGTKQRLADRYFDQKSILKKGVKHAGDIDRFIIDELLREISQPEEAPGFYFVLLDSTHFQYYWATDFVPTIRPYMERVPVVPIGFDPREIELLRNRYYNSVIYVDGLIGRVLAALRQSGGLEQSIVVVTGDHGEEFGECGQMLHGSALTYPQLEVPLLIRLPEYPQSSKLRIASHVDIFPTIFDYLKVKGSFLKMLSGYSLIGDNPPSWSVAAQNGYVPKPGFFPLGLAIDLGDEKLVFQIIDAERVGRSIYAQHLTATKLVDRRERELTVPNADQPRQLPPRFAPALQELLDLR
jgi:membrane-anchored protein YejM (alkaline phosphatase superfamily)